MKTAKTEIERKYLIRMPDKARLEQLEGARVLSITQTYLVAPAGTSRRVRKTVEKDVATYMLTEKETVGAISRLETETPLSEEEYTYLLREADEGCMPIRKIRYAIPYGSFCYEIDLYPFSEELAVMEVELPEASVLPPIPPFAEVVEDVSEDRRYSNHSLARSLKRRESEGVSCGEFPPLFSKIV